MAQTALNIYQQTVTTYNTIVNNLKYFNSKQIWNTAENALLHSTVQNTYGETAGLQSQLNGQSQNASLVWKIMNLAISGTSSSFWSQEIVGKASGFLPSPTSRQWMLHQASASQQAERTKPAERPI